MTKHRINPSSCWLASTRAKPKIADYSIITLQPQLGDIYVYDKEFIIADLPGLIENARLGLRCLIIQNVLYNIFNQTDI